MDALGQVMGESVTAFRGKLVTVVVNSFSAVCVLALLGYWLDKYLEHRYYIGTLIGIMVGLVWGFYELIKFSRMMEKQEESE